MKRERDPKGPGKKGARGIAASSQPGERDRTNRNLLLVLEDDLAFGRRVSQLAESMGFSVRVVTGSREFREAYLKSAPSILLLDIVLGEDDVCAELDYLAEVRCSVPILLISGHDSRIRQSVSALGRGLLIADSLDKKTGFRRLAFQLGAYKVD